MISWALYDCMIMMLRSWQGGPFSQWFKSWSKFTLMWKWWGHFRIQTFSYVRISRCSLSASTRVTCISLLVSKWAFLFFVSVPRYFTPSFSCAMFWCFLFILEGNIFIMFREILYMSYSHLSQLITFKHNAHTLQYSIIIYSPNIRDFCLHAQAFEE